MPSIFSSGFTKIIVSSHMSVIPNLQGNRKQSSARTALTYLFIILYDRLTVGVTVKLAELSRSRADSGNEPWVHHVLFKRILLT